MRVPVVILAGGEGSRIGGAKPLRMLGGKTLLERAIEQASRWSDRPLLSLRNAGQYVSDAEAIEDEPGIEGPLAGLVAALRYAGREGAVTVLTVPVDMPQLPGDLMARLTKAMGDANAAIAASGGALHPVCGLWRTAALGRVPAFLATRKRSLRGFAAHVGHVAVEWPDGPRDPFFNINDAADLAAAEQRLRP